MDDLFRSLVNPDTCHLSELIRIRDLKIANANAHFTKHRNKMIILYDYAILSLKIELIMNQNYKHIPKQ